MPEATLPLSLRVTPEQFRALDEKARAAGLSRSDVVRQLINENAVPGRAVAQERDHAA